MKSAWTCETSVSYSTTLHDITTKWTSSLTYRKSVKTVNSAYVSNPSMLDNCKRSYSQ